MIELSFILWCVLFRHSAESLWRYLCHRSQLPSLDCLAQRNMMEALNGLLIHFLTERVPPFHSPRLFKKLNIIKYQSTSSQLKPRQVNSTSRESSSKIEISPIFHSPPCRWRLWWHFWIHITLLEFHNGKEFQPMPIESTVASKTEIYIGFSLCCLFQRLTNDYVD